MEKRLFVIAPYLPRTGPSTWLYQLISHLKGVKTKIHVTSPDGGSMVKDFKAICEVKVGGGKSIGEFNPHAILYWEVEISRDEVGQTRTVLIYHAPGSSISLCDKIICPHEHIENWIRRERPDIADKTVVIYSAVEPEKPSEDLKQMLNLSSPVVGHVGRMVPEKNTGALVEAVAGTDWTLMLTGNGPDEERLRELSKRLGSRVVFTGELENPWSAYGAMDLLCLPSRVEGFSFVTIEAALSDVPMLLTRVGASPFIFDDESVFWTTGEPQDIRRRLLEIGSNPDEAERRAIRARGVVEEKCSVERMTRECCNVLFGD